MIRPPRTPTLLALAAALSGQASPTTIADRLEQLAAASSTAGAPGCTVAVRSREGLVVRSFGLSNIEHGVANGADTVFHVGSIGKQVTAAAVLMLAGAGSLSLEDPVVRYLPELARSAGGVRIRHLLEHTSGIRDYGELLLIAGGRDTAPISREEVLDLLGRQRQLNFDPGTRFSYSGSGYALLALIVERVSGRPLADFAAERFFQPLGMTRTRFLTHRAAILPNRAQGYRRAGETWQRADYLSEVYGDGGLFTTAADLMRWTANLRTGAVGGEQVVRRLAQQTRLPSGEALPWGLGLEVRSGARGTTIGHGGRDFGFQAYQLHFFEPDVTAVALCNGREIDAYRLADSAAALALPAAAAPAAAPAAAQAAPLPPPATMAVTTDRLRAAAGIWFNPTTLAIRRVTLGEAGLVWARGAGTPLDPVGPERFQFRGQPVSITFSEPRDGVPTRLAVENRSGASPTVSHYQRVGPPASNLADYLGLYRSEETGTEYRVTASRSGGLTFRANPSFAFTAAPQFLDAFAVGEDVLVVFRRNRGRVNGMTVSTDRARGVAFARVR